jgi:hypothetical protein
MVSPSEVWIPINGGLEPGISDQVSAGLSKDFDKGIQLSVEGYYKWMDNVTDYRDGMSLVTARGFCDPVAQGRGKAYGLEFLAEKTSGDTRGHISYTWSKSLRKFDRTGMEINGGREFYAAGDRRHNLSISVTQRLSRNWDLSASWTYQSGRRTNIAATVMSGGLPDEYNAYNPGWKSTDMYNGIDYSGNPDYNNYSETYPEGTYLQDLVRMDTYGQRNSYTLPAVHRLDVSLSHHGSEIKGSSHRLHDHITRLVAFCGSHKTLEIGSGELVIHPTICRVLHREHPFQVVHYLVEQVGYPIATFGNVQVKTCEILWYLLIDSQHLRNGESRIDDILIIVTCVIPSKWR